jgi:HlyD family secretion protein
MKKLIIFFILTLASCGSEVTDESVSSTKVKISVVDANGELASSDSAVIGPPVIKSMWQYKITFLAPEGKEVKPGQPVVGFDPSELRQTLSIKSSQLRTAIKSLENTKLTNEAALEKQKLQLAEQVMKNEKAVRKWQQSKGLESSIQSHKLEIEYQLAANEVERLKRTLIKNSESNKIKISIAKNTVARLESEVKQMKSGVSRLTIMAPKAGIVIYEADHQGNKVSVGDTVWRGRKIVSLPSLERMIVKSTILEADAGKVKIGQKVDIRLDAAPERVFRGMVKNLGQIFRRKNPKQPNIIFDAEIELLEIDVDLMRPGMATRLKIHTESNNPKEKQMMVSNEAELL